MNYLGRLGATQSKVCLGHVCGKKGRFFLLRSLGMAELHENVAGREGKCNGCCSPVNFCHTSLSKLDPEWEPGLESHIPGQGGKWFCCRGYCLGMWAASQCKAGLGAFPAQGEKRHIGEGKVIPPSLAQRASGWDQRGEARRPENTGAIYSSELITTFLYSQSVCTVLFYMAFPVPGCPYCMFWNLVSISTPFGQHIRKFQKLRVRFSFPRVMDHHQWNTRRYKDILKNQKLEMSFSASSQTLLRSVSVVLWRSHWAFRPGETRRENSRPSKLFHRTLAWANSLFLELDAVFCELFSNLRNGDRRAAKTTRGEIKLVLSARKLCLLLGVCFFGFFSPLCVHVC